MEGDVNMTLEELTTGVDLEIKHLENRIKTRKESIETFEIEIRIMTDTMLALKQMLEE